MEAALVVDVRDKPLVVLATERVERRQRVQFRPHITMAEAHARQAPFPTDLLDEAVDGAVADRRVADLGDAGPQRTVRELRELLDEVRVRNPIWSRVKAEASAVPLCTQSPQYKTFKVPPRPQEARAASLARRENRWSPACRFDTRQGPRET